MWLFKWGSLNEAVSASFAVTEWEECSLLWNTVRLFLSPDVPFVNDAMEESQLLMVLE